MNKSRTKILDIISRIDPFDEREREDLKDIQSWIMAGNELFRRVSPDTPSRHLVSYIAMVDHARGSLLLVDHVKAGLWLPPGGHMEPDEDPHETVRRELAEELGPKAQMVASVASMPLFATVTTTRGEGSHQDVTLWYVVAGDEKMWLEVDPREIRSYRWLKFDALLATDGEDLDPEMHRFVLKLKGRL